MFCAHRGSSAKGLELEAAVRVVRQRRVKACMVAVLAADYRTASVIVTGQLCHTGPSCQWCY